MLQTHIQETCARVVLALCVRSHCAPASSAPVAYTNLIHSNVKFVYMLILIGFNMDDLRHRLMSGGPLSVVLMTLYFNSCMHVLCQ